MAEKSEMTNIRELPNIPPGLLDAATNNKLVVFIGAGVSKLMGCELWDDLARGIVDTCYEKGIINFKVQRGLLEMKDRRKVITICSEISKERGGEQVFWNRIEKSLGGHGSSTVYDSLFLLGAIFITTNADTLFHSKFQNDRICYNPVMLQPDNLEARKLYHIHGCIKEPQTMVFDLDGYFKRYADGQFKHFIKDLFMKWTIMFVGYGLAELDLLEYAFCRYGNNNITHYLLKEYMLGEEDIWKCDKQYYKKMNIEVIPYALDKLGYKQLEEVLKEWGKKVSEAKMIPDIHVIDQLIEGS